MFREALIDNGKKLWPLLTRFNDFYLAGGTALALQIGHRVSVDFDFFSEHQINKTLLLKVKKIFEEFSVQPSVNNVEELTIFADGIKVSFISYPFPVVKEPVFLDDIKLLSIAEIAATKAYSIGRRGAYKDYVDLYFTLVEKHATLSEIIELADKKFGGEFNSRLFLEQLVFLDDVESMDIRFLKNAVSKEDVLTFFTNEIKNLAL